MRPKYFIRVARLVSDNMVRIHPQMASRLEVSNGDEVLLINTTRVKTATVKVSVSAAVSNEGIEIPISLNLADRGDELTISKATTSVEATPDRKTEPLTESKDNEQQKFIQSLIVPAEKLTLTFADVVGFEDAKAMIKDFLLAVKEPDYSKRHPLFRAPRGIILFGLPGCGKSLFATALGGEVSKVCTFFKVVGGDMKSKWWGETEQRIKALFALARDRSPSIIFIDEIESVAANSSGDELQRQVVSTFLTERDGFWDKLSPKPVLLIGATNVLPVQLDPAFIRPGRIDAVLFAGLPEKEGRKRIFKSILSRESLAEDVNLDTLAQATEGYSGADINRVCEKAASIAVWQEKDTGQEKKISQEIIVEAIKRIAPSLNGDYVRNYVSAVEETKQRVSQ